MGTPKRILIEVMYKADYCLPCVYMDAAVQEILPRYEDHVAYRRVDIMTGKGKERYLQLCYDLFGKEAVLKWTRIAPVPSLLINGELAFDRIPPKFELISAIEETLQDMIGPNAFGN